MRRVVLTVRVWIVATVALGLFAGASCSNDDEEEPVCNPTASDCGEGGSGGSGGSGGKGGSGGVPVAIECASETCEPLPLPFDLGTVAPCCTDENGCGLDSSFLTDYGGPMFSEVCQARDQPGERDSECPMSAPLMRPELALPVTFDGCCRVETGTCGYMLDHLLTEAIPLGLGCIDSQPFLEGGASQPCTPGAGGDNGSGG